jgi:hypothetical protein
VFGRSALFGNSDVDQASGLPVKPCPIHGRTSGQRCLLVLYSYQHHVSANELSRPRLPISVMRGKMTVPQSCDASSHVRFLLSLLLDLAQPPTFPPSTPNAAIVWIGQWRLISCAWRAGFTMKPTCPEYPYTIWSCRW